MGLSKQFSLSMIFGNTRVSILPPSPSYPLILFVNLQIDIAQTLWYSNSQIDPRIPSSNNPNFQWSQILNWLVLDGELVY